MPQVDFYVLTENSSRDYFVCLLAQKAWKQGDHILINTSCEATAATLDELLWTFNDISFIPHALISKTSDVAIGGNMPVLIDCDEDHVTEHTPVVINLADDILQSNVVERIVEIVAGNEQQRQKSRQHYAAYRDRGYQLNKHTIESEYGRGA